MSILKSVYDWLHPKTVEPPPTTAEIVAADTALKSALKDLADAKSRSGEVTELVSRAESQLAQNHFGALVEASMRARA